MNSYNNPFNKWRGGFNVSPPSAQAVNPGNNMLPLSNRTVVSAPASEKKLTGIVDGTPPVPMNVNLPPHLFVPAGAQTIDIARSCYVLPGTIDEVLMSFNCPDGVNTNFLQYGIFNEGEDASLFEFRPVLNGSRIFPFHGDPNNNFKISAGTGFDLSSIALRTSYISIAPLSLLEWRVTNISTETVVMGIRMTGYFMSPEVRDSTRFGG